LNIAGAATSNGGLAVIWPYQNGAGTNTNDQWSLNLVSGSTYQIVNKNSGLTLEMPNANPIAGTQFDQWQANSPVGTHQQFTLTPVFSQYR
jgi:ricin-type beta-trefoil lectin protein